MLHSNTVTHLFRLSLTNCLLQQLLKEFYAEHRRSSVFTLLREEINQVTVSYLRSSLSCERWGQQQHFEQTVILLSLSKLFEREEAWWDCIFLVCILECTEQMKIKTDDAQFVGYPSRYVCLTCSYL